MVFKLLLCIIEEEAVIEVFHHFKLFYPVEITTETEPPLRDVPWIKPSDLLKAMGRMNDMSRLLGGISSVREAAQTLESFWSKYRQIFPQRQLFQEVDRGSKAYSQCLPIYIHGDEGVCYKKGGVLIVSWQSAFGFGCSKRSTELREKFRRLGENIPLNFLRTGMQTRLLSIVCPKEKGLTLQNLVWGMFELTFFKPIKLSVENLL